MTHPDLGIHAKSFIRSSFDRIGLDVRRADGEYRRLARVLHDHGVSRVFDIGANEGQYASSLRRAGYGASIVSFEPLASAHARLRHNATEDPNWQIAAPMALSDSDGQIDIHVSENVTSSSALDMLPAHERAAPDSRYVGRETVHCARLDTVAPVLLRESDRLFLKLDVQGFEDNGSTVRRRRWHALLAFKSSFRSFLFIMMQ